MKQQIFIGLGFIRPQYSLQFKGLILPKIFERANRMPSINQLLLHYSQYGFIMQFVETSVKIFTGISDISGDFVVIKHGNIEVLDDYEIPSVCKVDGIHDIVTYLQENSDYTFNVDRDSRLYLDLEI